MKLIILEGTDRCGKDSLISKLSSNLSNYTIKHWSYPKGKTDEETTAWQKNTFNDEFGLYVFLQSRFPEHTLFWNRSHLGEYVYGSLYRKSNPENWVTHLEPNYGMDGDPNVYLIHLTGDAKFIAKNDDGKSYSSTLKNKEKEIKAFHSAVDNSKILNKLTIKINDGDNYRDITEITEEIWRFIGI